MSTGQYVYIPTSSRSIYPDQPTLKANGNRTLWEFNSTCAKFPQGSIPGRLQSRLIRIQYCVNNKLRFWQKQNNPDLDVATDHFPHCVLSRNVVSTKRYYKNIVFWQTQTFHNALWLFQRYPHSEFCFVAILLFTEPIVVIIFAQWPFSRIAPNIYILKCVHIICN